MPSPQMPADNIDYLGNNVGSKSDMKRSKITQFGRLKAAGCSLPMVTRGGVTMRSAC